MIQYTIVKKKVLTGSHPGEIKYYPKIVRAKTIDTDEIAELLQQRTTLGESEVRAFLNGLSQAIRYYVCASYPVEVEGLGRFTPSIKAKAMDSPEVVTAATITHKGVNIVLQVRWRLSLPNRSLLRLIWIRLICKMDLISRSGWRYKVAPLRGFCRRSQWQLHGGQACWKWLLQ